jgi:adenylylsulfate reductase subunit A
LNTAGITPQQEDELFKAYLNMAPAQTLRWFEDGKGPASMPVEIEGTEPYIVGGHTASGYWIDRSRATTLPGLYAAGDVAGGSPQKYVTGCFAEGEIAALSALTYIAAVANQWPDDEAVTCKLAAINAHLEGSVGVYTIENIEEAMQKVMDVYAGGITSGYAYNSSGLKVAQGRIEQLLALARGLRAQNLSELMSLYEVLDRLGVCQVLLEHLAARRETRWHSFQENADYPDKDDHKWLKYVNSRLVDGRVQVILRDLVGRDEHYEHRD